MMDLGAAGPDDVDCEGVEPHAFEPLMSSEVVERNPAVLPNLLGSNGVFRQSIGAKTRLDLDKHDGVVFNTDKVRLAGCRAVVAFENLVSPTTKVPGGNVLAELAQLMGVMNVVAAQVALFVKLTIVTFQRA